MVPNTICLCVFVELYEKDEEFDQNLHLLNEDLGIGGVDVIGERVIDEDSNVHDYPLTGGSTIDERPLNMYDFDPVGTFTNLDYDSFGTQYNTKQYSCISEIDMSQMTMT